MYLLIILLYIWPLKIFLKCQPNKLLLNKINMKLNQFISTERNKGSVYLYCIKFPTIYTNKYQTATVTKIFLNACHILKCKSYLYKNHENSKICWSNYNRIASIVQLCIKFVLVNNSVNFILWYRYLLSLSKKLFSSMKSWHLVFEKSYSLAI